jgi:Zn-dependent peptidase ImmA (M78 family)
LSGGSAGAKIEQFCNDVAGHLLLPASEVSTLSGLRSATFSEQVRAISAFADDRRISRSMVLYKLFRLRVIDEDTWAGLNAYFREQWLASKSRKTEKQKSNEGGPSYYTVRRHRLGNALLGLIQRSLNEGLISYTKAGQVLGVKPRNVDPLLRLTRGGK